MLKLETLNDNTLKDIPEQPIITYELVADFGEYGTRTVYETSSLAEIYVVIDEIKMGELNRPNLELTTNELKFVVTLSILIQLSASYLAITNYGDEMRAEANLKSYKVVREETPKLINGLCPRNWDNSDVSPLSELQINGILNNCEKCQRYSQCNKVIELNNRLLEIDYKERGVKQKAETFHNDINKVADMLLIGKDEFLEFYSYLSEEDYNITINKILCNLFNYSQRQEYVEFLISEGDEEYAKKILPEHFMSDNKDIK